MGILLLVRSMGEVLSAVKAATDFLASRRRGAPAPQEADEVLGVWVRPELDAGLPAWPDFGGGAGADLPTGARPDEASVGIRESVSLSGLWALCWIDGAPLRKARTPAERRRGILEAFLKEDPLSGSPDGPGTFFPVFGADEAGGSPSQAMRELREARPRSVGKSWFVGDPERGIVFGRGAGE